MLLSLGQTHGDGEEYRQAEDRLRQALAALDQIRTEGAPLGLQFLQNYAVVTGQQAPGLNFLAPVFMTLFKPLTLPFFKAMTQTSLGGILSQKGDLEQAEAELGRALDLSRLLLGMLDAPILEKIGQVQRRRWRLDEAARSFQGSLASLDRITALLPHEFGLPPAFRFRLLGQLAEVDVLRGRKADALAWNDHARNLAREAADRKLEVQALGDRAMIHTQTGDFRPAGDVLAEAARLAEGLEDRALLADLWSDLGGHALAVGRYEEAARWQTQAISMYQQLGEPYLEAGCQLLLAEAYYLADLTTPTRRSSLALERAVDLARKSGFAEIELMARMIQGWGGDPGAAASLPVTLPPFMKALILPGGAGLSLPPSLVQLVAAEMLGTGMSEEEKLRLAQRSLEGSQAQGHPFFAAIARLPLLREHLRRGETERAFEETQKLFAALDSSGQEDLAALSRTVIAGFLWQQGRRDEALRQLEGSVSDLDRLASRVQTDELLIAFLGGGRRLPYLILVEMLAEAGRHREAFAAAERARARGLLRLLDDQRLRPRAGEPMDLLARAGELRDQILQRERLLPLSEAEAAQRLEDEIGSQRSELEELLLRVQLSDPEYSQMVGGQPATLEAIQQGLDPGTTLISYFVSPRRAMAWVIDRDRVRWVPLAIEEEDREAAACLVQQIARRGQERGALRLSQPGASRGCAGWKTLSQDLYRKLFAPLPEGLNRHLVIAAHDVFHRLPFAVLRNPRTGRYLIEDYTLSYVPSASVVPLLRPKRSASTGRALVIGDPASVEPGLGPLRWAAGEAQQVADLLGTAPLLGSTATESRVRERLAAGVDLLHVAAHGVFLPGHPRFSYLALAADERHDGRLEMHEVFAELDLTGVDLVVLSACNTARGLRTGGDELIGFIRAFLYAGSPAVLATLWPVDDAASAGLMTGFYRRLRAEAGPARALQQAQIEMLRTRRLRDPYFWAAFTLNGDPGDNG